jgi:hypothetical protein
MTACLRVCVSVVCVSLCRCVVAARVHVFAVQFHECPPCLGRFLIVVLQGRASFSLCHCYVSVFVSGVHRVWVWGVVEWHRFLNASVQRFSNSFTYLVDPSVDICLSRAVANEATHMN